MPRDPDKRIRRSMMCTSQCVSIVIKGALMILQTDFIVVERFMYVAKSVEKAASTGTGLTRKRKSE